MEIALHVHVVVWRISSNISNPCYLCWNTYFFQGIVFLLAHPMHLCRSHIESKALKQFKQPNSVRLTIIKCTDPRRWNSESAGAAFSYTLWVPVLYPKILTK